MLCISQSENLLIIWIKLSTFSTARTVIQTGSPHHWFNRSQTNTKNTPIQGLTQYQVAQLANPAVQWNWSLQLPMFWQESDWNTVGGPFEVALKCWGFCLLRCCTFLLNMTNVICLLLPQLPTMSPCTTYIVQFCVKSCKCSMLLGYIHLARALCDFQAGLWLFLMISHETFSPTPTIRSGRKGNGPSPQKSSRFREMNTKL